jgi:hypothetical protein
MSPDDDHLRLLSIFHYVVGAMAGFFALLPIIYAAIGSFILLAPIPANAPPEATPPPFLGWFFIVIGFIGMAIGWTFALALLVTGRFLGRRRHHTFCLVVAAIECTFMPFGTILGIFTIIVLMRESVKQQFGIQTAPVN